MDRFWSKVSIVDDEDSCWLWTASLRRNGYGAFSYESRSREAHQVAWVLNVGPIPDGLWVLHRCDVRHCVRPSHLFLGTRSDNVRDMVSKGRHFKGARVVFLGESNPAAKVTDQQAEEIKRLYAAGGISQQRLAERYGLEQTSVSYIIRRRRVRST
jgi:hypothetical protein